MKTWSKQRQQERRHTMAVHVRYKSLYIFLPSAAKQQREMTRPGSYVAFQVFRAECDWNNR